MSLQSQPTEWILENVTEHSAIAVFTGKSVSHILEVGGSSSWVLNRSNAKKCQYLVCCRSGVEWVEGNEPHGSAFLVGIIDDVVPSGENTERWLIRINQHASVDVANVWKGWRNPVRYSSLEELGIDPQTLEFLPVPKTEHVLSPRNAEEHRSADQPAMTIVEAKRALARTFGVREEAIEITIRG